MSAPGSCQRCGVCCFSPSQKYVRVTGDDWARFGPDADHWAHFIGHRAYLRMEAGHCLALAERSAADGSRAFFCTNYNHRPQVCRDLQRGSPECAGELFTKGGPVGAGR